MTRTPDENGERVAKARADEPSAAVRAGREHYGARRWADAFDALSSADAEVPLDVDDLDLLAWSSGLTGRDDEMMKHGDRLYRAHSAAGASVLAARWAFWLGFRLLAMGEPGKAGGWLGRAQRLVEGDEGEGSVVRGYLLLPVIRRQLGAGEFAAARASAAEALALGERFHETDLVVFARCFLGRVLIRQGQLDEGMALLDEVMLSVTGGEVSPIVTGLVYCTALVCCQQAYALHRAREWTQAFSAWCEAQPQLTPFAGTCRVHRSEILQLGGAWSEAIEEAQRASRVMETTVEPAAPDALYQEAEIYRLRGEFAAAEEGYRRANQAGRDPQPGLALLRLAQGRPDVAATAIRRVVGAAVGALERARLLPAFVEILLASGDVEGARAGVDELCSVAAAHDIDVLSAMAAHAHGALLLHSGDARAAHPLLRRAFEVWQRVGAPYVAARIRASLSRACRELGDHDGAELERAAAREVFERLGAANDLMSLGKDGAPAHSEERHGLTPREFEVLRLLATGKTNKAISEELCLSEKTVDRHVSNIFAKANLSSRAAATAFAYEHGIVRPERPRHG